MNKFEQAEVVMLPTNNKKNSLWLDTTNVAYLLSNHFLIQGHASGIYQHLYIIIKEELKKGDWYMWKGNKQICKADESLDTLNRHMKKNDIAKIIATTDKLTDCLLTPMLPTVHNQFISAFTQSFNRNKAIAKVFVEYEPDLTLTKVEYKLKIDRFNTINTKELKETWTRDELKELFRQHEIDVIKYLNSDEIAVPSFNEHWTNQNL